MPARLPNLNQVYYDGERELLVLAVDPSDREGREVRGKITSEDGETRDYATTLLMFRGIWREHI